MSDDVTIVHYFVIFYLFGDFFPIYLCQFELLEILLSKQKNILLGNRNNSATQIFHLGAR